MKNEVKSKLSSVFWNLPQSTIKVNFTPLGLVTSGVINKGQGNSLTKLEFATEKLNHRNTNVAINELQAFIKEVQANVRAGILTQAQGQELIDAANAVISQLVVEKVKTVWSYSPFFFWNYTIFTAHLKE